MSNIEWHYKQGGLQFNILYECNIHLIPTFHILLTVIFEIIIKYLVYNNMIDYYICTYLVKQVLENQH